MTASFQGHRNNTKRVVSLGFFHNIKKRSDRSYLREVFFAKSANDSGSGEANWRLGHEDSALTDFSGSPEDSQQAGDERVCPQVSSVHDSMCAGRGKAHMRSTPSLRSFPPNVAFETVQILLLSD